LLLAVEPVGLPLPLATPSVEAADASPIPDVPEPMLSAATLSSKLGRVSLISGSASIPATSPNPGSAFCPSVPVMSPDELLDASCGRPEPLDVEPLSGTPTEGVEAELLPTPLGEALPEAELEGELDDEGELALGLLAPPLLLGLAFPDGLEDELEGGAGGAGVLGEVGVLALGQPLRTAHNAATPSQRKPSRAVWCGLNNGITYRSITVPYPQPLALPMTKSCPGSLPVYRLQSGV
jgi:hypothetical protein